MDRDHSREIDKRLEDVEPEHLSDNPPVLQRLLDSGLEEALQETDRSNGNGISDIELDLYLDNEPSSERRLLEKEIGLVQASTPGEQTSLADSQGRDTLRTSSDRSSSPRAKWETRRHGHGFLSSDSGFGADDSTDNAGQHSVMLDPKVTINTGSTISGNSRNTREFPRPPKYLPLAILVSFGNPPLGILAIIFSILTERDVRKGDLQEAKRKSKITMLTIIMAFAVTILTIVVTLVVCTAQNRLAVPQRKYVVKSPGNGSYVKATSAPDVRPPETGSKPNSGKGKMPAFLQHLVNADDKGEEKTETAQVQPGIPQLPRDRNGTRLQGWRPKNGTLLDDLRQRLFH